MTAKSTIKATTHSVAKALRAEHKPAAETDVLDTLKKEHDEVKSLLADLQNAETAPQRKQLVQRIKAALVPHTKAEEKVVYDAIISSSEEKAETDGREGYLEHWLASKTLEKLQKAAPMSPEHMATAKVLKELVEHHIKEEESVVWNDVKAHFDKQARMRMNVEFEAAKRSLKLS
jgi:hemerythrin superfamily protein